MNTVQQDACPRLQARALLWRFFVLQRYVLGADRLDYALIRSGWLLHEHMRLCQTLGHGCHNLAEIAAGLWMGHEPADDETLRRALHEQCRWLYERAQEGLRYPAEWDRDDQAARSWHSFWEAVAEPLGLPVVVGAAWEKFETQEHALSRLHQEIRERNLHRVRPWWKRVMDGTFFTGSRESILPYDIRETRWHRWCETNRDKDAGTIS